MARLGRTATEQIHELRQKLLEIRGDCRDERLMLEGRIERLRAALRLALDDALPTLDALAELKDGDL